MFAFCTQFAAEDIGSMNRIKLHRSAAVRMALLFVGLFAVCIAVAFTALYLRVSEDLDEHQKADVLRVQSALVDALKDNSVLNRAANGSKQLTTVSDEATVYVLTNKAGAYVLGNIQPIDRFSGWKLLPWSELSYLGTKKPVEPEEGVLGTWTDIPVGQLFVGTSDGDAIEAREMLEQGLALALAIAAAAALGSGAFIARRVRSRIETISTALDVASSGDLTVRIPHKARGDELDHIAGRINSTLDRLQSSISSLRQVTTDIAHDLKSPIGRVKQRLQRSTDTATSASEYREVVNSTVNEIDKIVDTFNALLSISQIEGGLQKQRFSDQPLRTLLATVVDAYAAVAEDAGQTLSSEVESLGNELIFGDKDLLMQLFANLVENAIRHCPPGSRISIAAEVKSARAIVRISDDGPGIPADERQNVFRRLYRLEKSRTTPGSGLGLALVSAIGELHDAKIKLCDNAPGLVVDLQFPLRIQTMRTLAAQ